MSYSHSDYTQSKHHTLITHLQNSHEGDLAYKLHDLIVQTIKDNHLTSEQVLERMGYLPKAKGFAHALTRLENVISSPDLGLVSSSYDLKYSSHEFIRALCKALSISEAQYLPALAVLEQYVHALIYSSLPYICVDVSFNDNFRPSFTGYAVISRYLRVPLEDRVRLLDQASQLIEAQRAIKAHYHQRKGKLPFEGEIKGYRVIFNAGSTGSDKQEVYISTDDIE